MLLSKQNTIRKKQVNQDNDTLLELKKEFKVRNNKKI